MNPLLLFITISSGIAGLILLRISVIIIRCWLEARWVKLNGIETEARILQVEVMNEPGRRIPFVKLKIAVITLEKGTFIAVITTFFHPSKLPQLTANGTVTIRYNPSNISQLQFIKRPAAVKKEQASNWKLLSTKGHVAMVQ